MRPATASTLPPARSLDALTAFVTRLRGQVPDDPDFFARGAGESRDPYGPRKLSARPLTLSDETRLRGGRRSRRRRARVWK